MKKFLFLLTSILMAFCCVATACSPADDGDMTNQEIAEVYRVAAVQTLQKIGVNAPETGGNKPFAVSFPNSMTEANSDYQIKQIKLNAKDSAGIMYLLSLLYNDAGYKTVNGIARFDVTYTLDSQTVTQHMNIKSILDKENNKLYFESMVYTPQFNADGYTYADITYDFDLGYVIDCRFIMEYAGEYRDMKLTAEGKYLWYETEEMDAFATAVKNEKDSFIAECNTLTKLTTDFGPHMMEYLRFSGLVEDQINNGQTGGDNVGGDNEGGGSTEGDKDVIQGGEVEIPDGPVIPPNQEVDATTWNDSLDYTQITKYALTYENGVDRVHYEVNGTTIIKWAIDPSTGMESPVYYGFEDGEYVRYTLVKTDIDVDITKTTISEAEYNEVAGKVRINFASILPQDQFSYVPESACYMGGAGLVDNINMFEVCFSSGILQRISYVMNDTFYYVNFSYDLGPVELPSNK